MKKRIRLTEQQLRNLITKAVLTETNWKTYMNAANKARERCLELGYYDENERAYVPYETKDWGEFYKNLARMEKFIEAARESYNKEYGEPYYREVTHREDTDSDGHPMNWERTLSEPWDEYEHSDDETDEEYDDNTDYWYGITDTYFPDKDNQMKDNYMYDDDEYVNGEWWSYGPLKPHSHYSENSDNGMWTDDDPDRSDIASSWYKPLDKATLDTLPSEFKDVYHYDKGNWEWVKGKGWQLKQKNESLARRVTESIIRKLRRV